MPFQVGVTPFTITDFDSRYLSSTKEDFAFAVFERVLKEFGVPLAIRTDNGVPFSSPNALYRGLPELEYPFHDKTVTVTTCGRIYIAKKRVNVSVVFAGQKVGIKQVDDRIWLTSFMSYDLGYFDEDACRLEPIANPFAAKVLPGGLQ